MKPTTTISAVGLIVGVCMIKQMPGQQRQPQIQMRKRQKQQQQIQQQIHGSLNAILH